MQNLVIVESPAKGKTIEKYLGKEYVVRASVGHIRDLKKKEMGINLETFEPEYIVSEDKKKVVSELKRVAKKSDTVWIATDEDREWEAIGWHLCETLGLDPKTTKRVTYGEITKKAITAAFANPGTIDQSLVDAQQARRLLDRIVGFEVSPVLWRKIPSGGTSLSAGRVQSVAVRLVVDKEKEIEAFVPKESWKLKATCLADTKNLEIDFAKYNGKGKTLKKQEDAISMLSDAGVDTAKLTEKKDKKGAILLQGESDIEFTLNDVVKRDTKRTPAAPFTTSTLQQEASRKLWFGVKQPMAVAQNLYQNGMITYMRTDSVNISQEAIDMSLSFIDQKFGDGYAVKGGRKYKTKDSGAQEAHEAIRPSYIDKTPENVRLDGNDLRLYTLIWNRTVASQMNEAKIETTTYSFSPEKDDKQIWQAKGQVIVFDGFMRLYIEWKDDENDDDGTQTLPKLKTGDIIRSQKIQWNQSFSRPPARYTEAALVKKLESEGIGRPSTYAPTIGTIIDRGYIERDKKHLFPTSLARLVTEYLETNFSQMMDYKFTAKIEEEFDTIALWKKKWKKMLSDFYTNFHPKVIEAAGSERLTWERSLWDDPKTGKPIIARMGRYGPMVQIGSSEDEEKPRFASIPKQFSIETITLDDALTLFALPRVLGEMDGEEVKANIGRFGPYAQLGKLYASIPVKFEEWEEPYDVFSITFEQAKKLIKAKQEIEANKYINEFDNGIQVLRGRYGPYIRFDGGNYKIPKDKLDSAEKLTLEECQEIVDTVTPSGKRGAKRTTKKKPTTRKKK